MGSELEGLYSKLGRPPIPPEQLLRALLLRLLYSVRSERMLGEQLKYKLLFCWFVGLRLSEHAWDPSSFNKNRERLLDDQHFTVDGTLIEAWASEKSYREKPGPPAKGCGSGWPTKC
jgi:transposase